MSEPTIVVLPASGNGGQQPDQQPADIASAIQNALHQKAPEQAGPLRQMLAQPDSLYKYINWEDPIRTLGVYIGALSILFGAHYLPLTQLALKAGLTTLGVVSVTEFASRSFTANSLSTRLRPKEYKKIPEPTLNATLRDVHDFIQYASVQVQRTVFGQDLDKTFAAFLGCTALYWLTGILSPFWLAVMGLTSIFIAPLVSSPKGRGAARDASVRAQSLANAATEKGKVLAQNGSSKAAELSSKGKQTAADLSAQARGAASNLSSQARSTASDLSAQARGTASDVSGTAAENINKLPQKGSNAINQAPGVMSSAYRDAKGYINTSAFDNVDGNYDGNRSVTGGLVNKASHLSNSISETAKHLAPGMNVSKQQDSDHLQNVYSVPAQTTGGYTGSLADADFKYVTAEDPAATYDILDRS